MKFLNILICIMTDEQKQRYKEKIIIPIIKDDDHFNDVIEL